MAKDKSTKKSTSDGFAKPSEAPAGGDGWSLTDGDKPKSGQNDGELFLITPTREQEIPDSYSKTPGATKKVVVADVVHLNEKKPEKSVEHEEVFVFGGWLMGGLRAYIGEQRVLARLQKAPDKKSATGYVWKFEDGDDDDVEVARAYLDSLSPFPKKGDDKKAAKAKKAAPVETKAAKKSKAEPEPKGKKSKAEPEPKGKKKGKK